MLHLPLNSWYSLGPVAVFARELQTTPALVLGLIPFLGVLAMFGRERHQRLDGLLELNQAYRGTALALGDVVEADDGYTGEHCSIPGSSGAYCRWWGQARPKR
jgi:hypothetical protein